MRSNDIRTRFTFYRDRGKNKDLQRITRSNFGLTSTTFTYWRVICFYPNDIVSYDERNILIIAVKSESCRTGGGGGITINHREARSGQVSGRG